MKKTLVACLAVVAVLALASSASAITCTTDQHPAATLLIPYFQATFNPDGTVLGTGPLALDTLVVIGNASAAPMLAHVTVWSERSEVVLDFNVALTGFDIQSWSMSSILRGFLPQTPIDSGHNPPGSSNGLDGAGDGNFDVCQRNGVNADVYPDPLDGFLRLNPVGNPANSLDNTLATANYPNGPFGNSFLFALLDSLDTTPDSTKCGGTDGVIANPIHGYITIDHVNYCTLSTPDQSTYYTADAIGMENNLWGDYTFTSGAGVGTEGFAAVAIEADPSLFDTTAAPILITDPPGRRTFYRRYVTVADPLGCSAGNAAIPAFDCGAGDQREPLGLKYAARWFNDPANGITSFFNVWRGSSVPIADPNGLQSLLGPVSGGVDTCTNVEPVSTLSFYDEDENTVTSGKCPSPCTAPQFNFPLETQRASITNFGQALPNWPAGWVSMEFWSPSGPPTSNPSSLDQAYVTYDFQGPVEFLSAGAVGTQLDPSTCQPINVVVAPTANGVTVTLPVIPALVGTGPVQP
jgi:hypothetical protein